MDPGQGCSDKDKDALIAYLYDECEPLEREQVEAHLLACHRCANELESLRSVRGTLRAWTPPEPSLGFRIVSGQDVKRLPWWKFALQPAWGFGAALGIVLVVGLALAGLEVRFGEGGFLVRVGGTEGTDAPATPSADVGPDMASAGLAPTSEPSDVAPWHADLRELENQLRGESAMTAAAGGAPQPMRGSSPETAAVDRDALLQQFEGLIAQSERRQQQELALWLTEFAQEFDMQRHADQRRLQQELGALEGFADYLVRVSQR